MNKEQWQAVKERDAAYDDAFFCGLLRSRTVCRVSCGYRVREIRNVVIFPTLEEALRQGYKPCPHCRPDHPAWAGSKAELVQAAKRYLAAHSAEKFSLEVLSRALFINGCYLERTFRELTGHTLLWYHHAARCEKAKELLTHSELTISAVSDQAGFASSAHFSRIFKKMAGMTPTQYRNAYYMELDS